MKDNFAQLFFNITNFLFNFVCFPIIVYLGCYFDIYKYSVYDEPESYIIALIFLSTLIFILFLINFISFIYKSFCYFKELYLNHKIKKQDELKQLFISCQKEFCKKCSSNKYFNYSNCFKKNK